MQRILSTLWGEVSSAGKSANIDTVRKTLARNFPEFQADESEKSDFLISGKEAVLLCMYSNAFIPFDDDYKLGVRPVASWAGSRETIRLLPYDDISMQTSELVPINSEPLSSYFEEFPDVAGTKHLILVDCRQFLNARNHFSFERMIGTTLKTIKERGLDLTDCAIWPSEPDGSYTEDFFEYFAGLVLRRKGYIVSKYSQGGGDIFAYLIPEYMREIRRSGLLKSGGFIEELALIRKLDRLPGEPGEDSVKAEIAVVEAESSSGATRSHSRTAGFGQAAQYLDTFWNWYNVAYACGPHVEKTDATHPRVGLISLDEEGRITFVKKEPPILPFSASVETVKMLIKCVLLQNLSKEQRRALASQIVGSGPSLRRYIEAVISMPLEMILYEL